MCPLTECSENSDECEGNKEAQAEVTPAFAATSALAFATQAISATFAPLAAEAVSWLRTDSLRKFFTLSSPESGDSVSISGMGIIVAGALVLAYVAEYSHFVEGQILAQPVVLIVAGDIVFLVACLGSFALPTDAQCSKSLPTDIYQEGCYPKLQEEVDQGAKVLVGAGIGIAFIELAGWHRQLRKRKDNRDIVDGVELQWIHLTCHSVYCIVRGSSIHSSCMLYKQQ
ncbi:Tetraspanin 47F [Carabus blaptoides fortunei]